MDNDGNKAAPAVEVGVLVEDGGDDVFTVEDEPTAEEDYVPEVPLDRPEFPVTCRFFAPAYQVADRLHAEPAPDYVYNRLRSFHACECEGVHRQGEFSCQFPDTQWTCNFYQESQPVELRHKRVIDDKDKQIAELVLQRNRYDYGTPMYDLVVNEPASEERARFDGKNGDKPASDAAQAAFDKIVETFATKGSVTDVSQEVIEPPSFIRHLLEL